MQTAITAIGTANPPYQQKQKVAAELVSTILNLTPVQARRLKSIYKSTGIETRHSVLSDFCQQPGQFEFYPNQLGIPFPSTALRMQMYKLNALPLALKAIENCLAQLAKFNKNTITHLITVSCTGMYAPGIDIEIVQHLNLNSNIKRTAVNFMGCYGAFNALKLADAICKSDTNACVLMVCVELCTIHFQNKTDLDNTIANAIFADGAACALIQAKPLGSKHFIVEAFHCDLFPQSDKAMAWEIADTGFNMTLSAYVPQAIKLGIAALMKQLLGQCSAEIDFYAIHPGGLKILQACEEALNITAEHNRYAYNVLRNYGNMSSATILFVLKELWDGMAQDQNNKNIFSCAFGPGLTLESMLLRINYV